jgi:acyl-coenzyme A thioesterase PaaI-like protein
MADQPPEMTEDALRQALVDFVPFNQHLEIEVLAVQPGYGVVRLPERDFLRNHVGTQHAGALFLAGEAAGGAAFIGAFAADMGEITFLLKGATISYQALARGEITATCQIGPELDAVRDALDAEGRTRMTAAVTLQDAAGTLVGQLELEYSVRRSPPPS